MILFIFFNSYPEAVEISKGIPADPDYVFKVDGIRADPSRKERDWQEDKILVIAGKECRQHDIGKIVVISESADILFKKLALHQPVGSICIRKSHTENHAQNKTQSLLDKRAVPAVSADGALSDHSIIFLTALPEGLEL